MYSRDTQPKSPNRSQPALHLETLDWAGTIIFVTIAARVRKNYFATLRTATIFNRVWSTGSAWQVGEYVLMPDHVHLFARPCNPGVYGLRSWIAWWKSIVARELEMPVWQRGVWDVRMRSAEAYAEKREYVRQNPVRAGLVTDPSEWPYRGRIHDLVWRGGVD